MFNSLAALARMVLRHSLDFLLPLLLLSPTHIRDEEQKLGRSTTALEL